MESLIKRSTPELRKMLSFYEESKSKWDKIKASTSKTYGNESPLLKTIDMTINLHEKRLSHIASMIESRTKKKEDNEEIK